MDEPTPRRSAWKPRGSYCGARETSADASEWEGIPPGFCGLCDACGKPGHAMHFPGSAPCSGCWCRKHYLLTLWLHPYGRLGCLVWLAIVVGVIVWWRA